MRIRIFTLSFLVLCFTVCSLSAQTRVEKRAKQRANQNVDRKVDQAVDDVFNGLFKKKKKKPKASEADQPVDSEVNSEVMDADDSWEPLRNETPLSVHMDMTLTKKNGKTEKYIMQMVFDEWKIGMISKNDDGKVRFILNNQDGTMTTISESPGQEPQGFKMKQRGIKQAAVEYAADEFSITKTGNKRTIDGYETEEYLIEHQDGNTTSWITQDIEVDYANLMKNWQSQQKKQGGDTPFFGDMQGFPIESITVDKKGQITKIHYRDIKLGDDIDRSPLDVTGIKIMKMGL